jgi:hypothetical protein
VSDPISRLEFAKKEIGRCFHSGYAEAHSDVVSAVMLSASLDWAAMTIAAALVEPEQNCVPGNIVRGLQLRR